jgi:hypothetical protein
MQPNGNGLHISMFHKWDGMGCCVDSQAMSQPAPVMECKEDLHLKTLFFLLLWMAGCAMGQTIYIPGCQGFDCPPAPPKLLSKWEPRINAQYPQLARKPEAIKGRMVTGLEPSDPSRVITLVDDGKPEAIDVPAIQEDIPIAERSACGPTSCTKSACLSVCTPPETTRPACNDKTRILLHDEQTPPKYWCHKVLP